MGGHCAEFQDPTPTPAPPIVTASAADVFMSEYVEGEYNTKALELHNPTNQAVVMDGASLVWHEQGQAGSGHSISLDGKTILAGGTYVFCRERKSDNTDPALGTNTDRAETCDEVVGDSAACATHPNCTHAADPMMAMLHDGDDTIEYRAGGQVVDIIGNLGDAPNALNPPAHWQSPNGTLITQDLTIRRKLVVTHGSPVFNPDEWEVHQMNTVNGLGKHWGQDPHPLGALGFTSAPN